ncbi:MAG: HEPN domain-containing protein [Thermodesulfobacteriota bacterium]|jgi:HEPN domain-containing protein
MKLEAMAEGRRWLLQAERDLDDAEFNLSGGRYNVACFLAQQSAEKALKAYLFSKGAEEVWGHSVAELCKDAQTFDPAFSQLDPKASPLDKYYIPTRYPNALPGGIPSEAFDENDAKNAIRLTKEVIDFVKSRGGL